MYPSVTGDLSWTLRKNEVEWLKNSVMVGIGENINFVKEVDLPRNQFGWAAVIIRFQDIRERQRFHFGLLSTDLQHALEHNAMQRDTFHRPDAH